VILLLVMSGYGPPPAYAWVGDRPNAVGGQVFSLDELNVVDDYTKEELFIHGPEQAPPIDVGQRPTSPQETALQAQDILSITAGSVITVISSRGVHNDPTLSADGKRVAFWSTANLAPKRPSPNTMFINEIATNNFHPLRVYVEIYNGGTENVDMNGWTLTYYDEGGETWTHNYTDFVLGAGSYRTHYFGPFSYQDSTYQGAVSLVDNGGLGIDFVRWGGIGTPPLVPIGTSYSGNSLPEIGYYLDGVLGRNSASTDTDSDGDWCVQAWTPGYQNHGGCGYEPENPDGNIEIYVADVETPELGVTEDVTFTQVSRSLGSILGGFNLQPSVSGDGSRVAFFSDRDLIGTNNDQNFEILVYDVATEQIYSVTNSLKGANILPSINDDGARIAFVSDRDLTGLGTNNDGNQEIFLAEVDGSWNINIVQVTQTSGDVINDQPSISADGNWIAFVSDSNLGGSNGDGNLEILVADVSGGSISFAQVTNTSGGVDNEQPSMDGDGSRVAYARLAGSASNVYWADAGAGWTSYPIVTTRAVNEYPSINSYGDRIVFVSGQSVNIYYTEFGQLTELATVLDTDVQPSRPDIATGDSYLDTWVVFAAGGALYHVYYPLQDISIDKQFEPQQVGPGYAITYTIRFANHGMDPAPNAYITDTIPPELLNVQCHDGGYALITTTQECQWNLGFISSGDEGVVTVTAIISTGLAEGYTITNTATITSSADEANSINNHDIEVITIINLPPTGYDNTYRIREDGVLTRTASGGVLGNDVDPNGDILTATLVTDVLSGMLTLNQDGSFTYTPTLDFYGTDSFVYRAYDGHGGTATATATIDVLPVDDAPVNWLPDPQSIPEDTILTLAVGSGNAITVSDVDAGSNAIQVTLTVTDGTLTLDGTTGLSFSNGDGADDVTMTFAGTIADINTALDGLVFSPTLNFSGTTSLQIVSNDQGYFGSFGPQIVTDTLSINVIGINDAPVLDLDDTIAGKDAQHTYEGANPDKWIAPDASVSDVDTQIAYATVTLLTHPDGISETLACGDCALLYGITDSYSDTTYTLLMTVTRATFSYQEALKTVRYDNSGAPPQIGDRVIKVVIYDTGGLTDTAVSTITLINSRPVATDDLAFTPEETAVDIDVLANDDDIDNDPITITIVGAPSHGTAVTATVGMTVIIRYTPETDFVGTDVFTYTIRDLPGGTDTATVTVTVTGDNDKPVNTVPTATQVISEDTALVFGVGNRVAITDVDAYTNAVQVALTTTHGILLLGNPGSVTITGGADGSSSVVFTGTITDVNTALLNLTFSPTLDYSGSATVTIYTNDLGNSGAGGPQSDTDSISITIQSVEDPPRFTSTPVPTATFNVGYVYNITTIDPDGPGPITITAPVLPSWLVLVDNGDGTATLSGTPALSDRGIHNVTLEARDATALMGTQVFTIEVLAPELSIAKHATHPDPLVPGSTITYTIVISNVGSLAATNVTVSDTVPTNTNYIMGSSQIITYRAGEVGEYFDQFSTASYSNSDGTTDWSGTPWVETNDDGNPEGGKIWVYTALQRDLRFEGTSVTDTFWIERPVDLRGVATATLEFRYDEDGSLEATDQFTVSVFDGATWHVLLSESGNFGGFHTFGPQSIITYANSDTRIRFQVTGFSGGGERVEVDDVEVAWEFSPIAAGRTPPGLVIAADGYDLQPGEFLTVTFAVTVDTGLAADSPIVNTASVTCTEVSTPTDATVTSTATLPRISFSGSTYSVGEGGGQAVITVTQNAPSSVETRVNYATSNSTAQAGSDYAASSGTLIFSPGTTTLTFTVSIINDVLDEYNETVNLALSNPVSATLGTPNVATLTIVDNDPQPSLTIADVSVIEGRTGSVNAVFTVTLSAQSGRTVAVNYATADNSATTGDSDYTANSGSLSFVPGVTTRLITVVVHGDIDQESDETFYVNLSGPTNATIVDGQGTGTIANDDHEFTAVEDAWIRATDPDVNHGSETTLRVRPESIVTTSHTLIQFDVSSVPSTTTISYAALLIYETTSNSGQTISVRRVLTDWVEGQATWNDRSTGNAWSSGGGDYSGASSGSFAANTTGWREVEITTLVQGWIAETYENYGLLLLSTTTGNTDAVLLNSREGTNDPVLVIVY
jgi:uncharacterized repeat protein (TIGR01451 family)